MTIRSTEYCHSTAFEYFKGLDRTVCKGYKTKLKTALAWRAQERCCKLVRDDPECKDTFYLNNFPSGHCYCERKGYNCVRGFGFYTFYRIISKLVHL